jgi:hypothetical protein
MPNSAPAPDPPAAASSATAPTPPPADLPTACASTTGELCTPPNEFVDRLCDRNYADAALSLFAKSSPFTRVFLRGKVEAWYAGGGASSREVLAFDEEVLVLRFRSPNSGGIIVNDNGGSYDVLRWNGNCFTLDGGEVTAKRPPKPRTAPIQFHRLDDKTQNALLENTAVRAAYAKRGKECKGATSGEVTTACVRADDALSAAVVDYVRGGGTLPRPLRLP